MRETRERARARHHRRKTAGSDLRGQADTASKSRSIGYNFRFAAKEPAMEAERVNQIAASLADLRQRTAELRRYL